MRVRLISRDPSLHRLCREVLLEFRGRDWDYGMVGSPEEAVGADLRIWDVVPELLLPKEFNSDQAKANIFLVDRQGAVTFLEEFPLVAMNVLLKPVNDRVLHDFLEYVVAQHEVRCGQTNAERVGHLRIDRDEMLQSLLYSNLKLQEFDQGRTRFLAQCVHEFRAPLMAVYGYCSMLLNKQAGPLNSEQARILDRMRHSTCRLSRLTASMFEMSVGRRIHASPPVKAGDIEACIAQAVYETSLLADAKNITVRVKKASPTRPILLAPAQIEQVLVNLLENACRFTPGRGRIEIEARPVFWERRSSSLTENLAHEDRRGSCCKEPNSFRVEVRDSGAGIRPEDIGRIFEEFASESAKTDLSRAGLGLSICRQIIQTHRGHIFAESTKEGARFVFLLPYAPRELRVEPFTRAGVEASAMEVAV